MLECQTPWHAASHVPSAHPGPRQPSSAPHLPAGLQPLGQASVGQHQVVYTRRELAQLLPAGNARLWLGRPPPSRVQGRLQDVDAGQEAGVLCMLSLELQGLVREEGTATCQLALGDLRSTPPPILGPPQSRGMLDLHGGGDGAQVLHLLPEPGCLMPCRLQLLGRGGEPLLQRCCDLQAVRLLRGQSAAQLSILQAFLLVQLNVALRLGGQDPYPAVSRVEPSPHLTHARVRQN